MSSSLRDQLIQAGLVTEKQARLASQQGRAPQQSRHQPPRIPEQQLAVQRAQASKAARDQELNRRQQAKAERAAVRAQVRQLVEQNQVPKVESDDYYNFIDGTRIKRIAVNSVIREQLNRGELRIARCDNRYALVPAAAAVRIGERDPAAIIAAVAPATSGDDGSYAAFAVPDDLTW
jgi:hypothetical protein